jgi:hypothetical protein
MAAPQRRTRVNTHKNSRTTPTGRALMVERVPHPGWTAKTAAASAGVSARTARKWIVRLVGRLKKNRYVATRRDELAASHLAIVPPAAIRIWLRRQSLLTTY